MAEEQFDLRNAEHLAYAVSYLTCQGFKQEEIRKLLGLNSQAHVSRSLDYARDEAKVFVKRVPIVDWRCSLALKTQIEALTYGSGEEGASKYKRLKKRIARLADANEGVSPSNVLVLYSGPSSLEPDLQLFGRNCAPHIIELLQQAHSSAVAWGRTIKAVVNAIEAFGPSPASHDMLFMPLSGEPINFPAPGMSSSDAAAVLARAFGGSSSHSENTAASSLKASAKSLRGVGVRIPEACGRDADAIRRFVAHCKHYKEIFSEPERRIRTVDAILTGLGDANTSRKDAWFMETCDAEGLQPEQLIEMAIGNIGGWWYPKSKRYSERVDALNDRWLGIKLEHFSAAANRAAGGRDDAPPGVIVVAAGRNKKNIVERIIGITNHLFIDTALADAIIEGVKD